LTEMSVQIEELERQYPDAEVAEAFTRGYQRGREHYEQLCKESRADRGRDTAYAIPPARTRTGAR
jgi:hypothetical protein